jgi:transposase
LCILVVDWSWLFVDREGPVLPRHKDHVVVLSVDDRARLLRVVRSGTHPARLITRARILLELDENHHRVAPFRQVVAERVGVSVQTVYLVAKQFTASGGNVDTVIGRKKRLVGPIPVRVTGDIEARVIALACSDPPEGYDRWSLRLLEKHVALMGEIGSLDHSTIGRALKKGGFVLT